MQHRANLELEKNFWKTGYRRVCGIDEVGRGPLAGPVIACAVIFEPGYYLPGVADSKILSATRREELDEQIKKSALCWNIGMASVEEIDRLNIRQATFLAMRRAVAGLVVQPDYLLVDGENLPESDIASEGVIDGDARSFTIAAASIIAKVYRDNLMCQLHKQFLQYDFAHNKGYGTPKHIQAIKEFGPSPHHRPLFLRKILNRSRE